MKAYQRWQSDVQVGDRVLLTCCNDPHSTMQPGELGTVSMVDGLGTVHVNWDCGSRLGLIPGVDFWTVLAKDSPTL